MRPPGVPVRFRRERNAGTGPRATTNLPPVPPVSAAMARPAGGTGGRKRAVDSPECQEDVY